MYSYLTKSIEKAIEPKGSQFLDSDNTFKNGKEGWKQEFL